VSAATSRPEGGANDTVTVRVVVPAVHGSMRQSEGQESLSLVLPSSHVSPALTTPSPHVPPGSVLLVELVEVDVVVGTLVEVVVEPPPGI
jgi:hypothetical protein